jgi:hypothetical protein
MQDIFSLDHFELCIKPLTSWCVAICQECGLWREGLRVFTLYYLRIENDLKILRYDFVVDIQDGVHTSKLRVKASNPLLAVSYLQGVSEHVERKTEELLVIDI